MCAEHLAAKQYITHHNLQRMNNLLDTNWNSNKHLLEMMRVDMTENKLALSKYLSLLINFLSLKVSLID